MVGSETGRKNGVRERGWVSRSDTASHTSALSPPTTNSPPSGCPLLSSGVFFVALVSPSSR